MRSANCWCHSCSRYWGNIIWLCANHRNKDNYWCFFMFWVRYSCNRNGHGIGKSNCLDDTVDDARRDDVLASAQMILPMIMASNGGDRQAAVESLFSAEP